MKAIFKKLIAGILAMSTILTVMASTASATVVTDSNDDKNFVYSNLFENCTRGTAGGYRWSSEELQAMYPEFTKSYLSQNRTFVSPRTYTLGNMIGMLDKSITNWHDAIQYSNKLKIKDKNGYTVSYKIERDYETGRFGLRAYPASYTARFDTRVHNSWVELVGDNYYHYVAVIMEGVHPGAYVSIPGYEMVDCTHTYTGARSYLNKVEEYNTVTCTFYTDRYNFGNINQQVSSFSSNGAAIFLLAKDLGSWFSLSGKKVSGKNEISIKANGFTEKTSLTASYSKQISKFYYGSRGVETAPYTHQYNCHGYAFGIKKWPTLLSADQVSRCISSNSSFATLRYVTAYVKDWAKNNGFSCREVYSHEAVLNEGEWLVAMRIAKSPQLIFDYHFWYRANNGKWYNKHGAYASEECVGVVDPSTADDSSGWGYGAYNSETVYLAVKRK